MQTLDLNLASKPFRNNTLLWVGCVAAVVSLIAFSIWNVRTYVSHRQMVREIAVNQSKIDGRMAELAQRERSANLAIRRYDLKSLVVKSNKANEVINWKAFSWTRLFNRMETIQPWNVKMLSIRPMFRTEQGERALEPMKRHDAVPVIVEGMAQKREGLWTFEDGLFSDPAFDNVDPRSDELVENSTEVLFTLRFDYFPGREERERKEPEKEGDAEAEVGEEEAPGPEPEADAAIAPGEQASAEEGTKTAEETLAEAPAEPPAAGNAEPPAAGDDAAQLAASPPDSGPADAQASPPARPENDRGRKKNRGQRAKRRVAADTESP